MTAKPQNASDWSSLSMEKRANACGIGVRTLSTYKSAGCPVEDGPEAIAHWRANNVAPRNGGMASRRVEPPPSELITQAIDWYIADNKKTLDLLDALNSAARDESLSDVERSEIKKKVAGLIKLSIFFLWLRFPSNRHWLESCSRDHDDDEAFEAFAESTIEELLELE